MDLTGGMTALRAGAELVRIMRDAAKSGTLKPDEFGGRLAEVYDYIIDSKEALLTAQETISQLRAEVDKFKDFVFHHGVQWRRTPAGPEDGPFCPVCIAEGVEMRLQPSSGIPKDQTVRLFECPKRHVPAGQGMELRYVVPKEFVSKARYVFPT